MRADRQHGDMRADRQHGDGIFSVDGLLRGRYDDGEEEPTWFESAVPGQQLNKRRKLDIDRYINKRVSYHYY